MMGGVRIPVLYLDTSVLGGYFDEEWKEATQELFRQMEMGLWKFVCSDVTRDEIQGAPEPVRELFANTFPPESLLRPNDEMDDLAAVYVAQKVVPPKYGDDALHVAVCTVSGINLLVSWNFKHLVSLQRESGFNAVNLVQGYPTIRIVSPMELIYGNQDQNL